MSDTELVKKAKRHAEGCDNERGSFLTHHLVRIRRNSFIQGYKEGNHAYSVIVNRKAREIKKLKAENGKLKEQIKKLNLYAFELENTIESCNGDCTHY